MRRCIVNAHTDWWRRRTWREQPRPLVPDQEERTDMPALHAARDVVLRALARLTARERAVVALRFYLDLTELQIAHELGIAPGTVKSTAARALTNAMWVSPIMWRDQHGNWWDGTRPACLKPRSRGQHISFAVVHIKPGPAVGGPMVVWVECACSPVPRYPVVTPKASGAP